ncbi:HlyD family efflux transporter periplasmic adaptor subunit [Trichocoleus sp. FACHB-90]|nr:HlyD family efflux transporter periplasmic adaptor subunit [Trichocoleus sp. FACHB-90]
MALDFGSINRCNYISANVSTWNAPEKARGESTLATLDKERKTLLQRRIEIQSQIEGDRRELQQTQTELKKSVVRSPASGTILQLNLRNGGQVVREAEPIAKIAPSNTTLVVKARDRLEDVGKVAVGQQVQMRSTYPYPDYATLKGKVSAIAPDATTPQRNETTTSGAVLPFYEVTIQPLKIEFNKGDRQYSVQPGMDMTADTISREETVLTFILRKASLITDL